MAVRIRLKRMGAKKNPFYRLVISDSRKPRDGCLDTVGSYRPLDNPATMKVDEAKILHWLSRGALPSETVKGLLSKTGVWQKYQELRKRPKNLIA